MQRPFTRKINSMTELREAAEVFNPMGDTPVVVVENIQTRPAGLNATKRAFTRQKKRLAPALTYLRDK